jgi:hypothetical protein
VQLNPDQFMKSISASILVLAGAILLETATDQRIRDLAPLAGIVLILIGFVTWMASLGRGPLEKGS